MFVFLSKCFNFNHLAILGLLFSSITIGAVHDPRALEADPFTATTAIAPALGNLGDHQFIVTTKVAASQEFVNQGYRLTLGFNHSEALRAFKEAVRLDKNNAMAFWGWALVLGPNLNLPMQPNVQAQAYMAISKAVALKNTVSAREKAYIEALAVRYSDDENASRSLLDSAFADAMAKLVKAYPDDLDAATLYAAAIMNTNPWDYWYRDGSPKKHTEVILSTLQSVLKRNPNHAGANHYLIHTVEAFRPELGVAAADRLGNLMPGAGHLVHMPSHIYMRVGRYADSYAANAKAITADEGYITQCRAQGLYPLAYYPHNIHFLVWSAMFQGRSEAAINAARQVADKIPKFGSENTWGLNEAFLSQPLFVLVRFGQWQTIQAEPRPPEKARFINGVWLYAQGMAAIHQGRVKQAEKYLQELSNMQNAVVKDANYYVGFGAAGQLLSIANNVLAGEIAGKKGQFEIAISHLEKAARLEDGLRYNEPPDWYFPVRHILGALLLEADLPAEAEVVYWEDLRRNPENGYSLFGLMQSLLAQGNDEVAQVIDIRLAKAWADADVTLKSSRF